MSFQSITQQNTNGNPWCDLWVNSVHVLQGITGATGGYVTSQDASFNVSITGPWAGPITTSARATRMGDSFIMLWIGETRIVSNGSTNTINMAGGSIPTAFRPTGTRILSVPVILNGSTFAMGLAYVFPDGSVMIGSSLNSNNAISPASFTGSNGEPVGFRNLSIVYAI